ncbi:hypothetical protein BKA82DRAFT_119106 [Pisolithus tinctorius]|uniref:Serine/threonine-protein phosphatase 2A activator n=1 Tax=Pisolithus tinctorius Marx 270 TaxID=870435 RepID=A0A0C3Q007_PISTI|nr:hypothetical protein BKA82DRAFT_119106 [Pisolithus tinctorius]KIO15134.1 hypothetical protein M404DRAFT_119106 [Pisolithus tinctorius Marx 270]
MQPQGLLPQLRKITVAELVQLPQKKIHTDDDVVAWHKTRGYRDFWLFLLRLNEAVVNHAVPRVDGSCSPTAAVLISILDELDSWIDDIPPLRSPQRFGNLAFRTWGDRLTQKSDQLLERLLGPELRAVIPYVKPIFEISFGSFLRMDYGTGHETSFAMFLCCLTLVRFFEPSIDQERELVLRVFVRYMRLCWRLQDVYKLEPAGSHGVWGLDDYSFLGYVFGSAQLREQAEFPVSAILRLPLPQDNLYCMCITRIHQVKHGPFHEHSSQLYAIATGVPNWTKVNSGLLKMYEGEVLSKRVVVQHLPLGGLLSLDED